MSMFDDLRNKLKPTQPESIPDQLSTQEIEILLSMLKRTTFLGEDIEHLYNLIVKLQNQYMKQNNS
jgi:hypothetical protein